MRNRESIKLWLPYMKINFIFGVLALFVSLSVYAAEGKVQYVHDGDTIRIYVNGEIIKIRLAGIDAPEIKQDFGLESKEILKSLIDNKIIYFESNKKDRYGRTIATLYLDPSMTQSINAKMVETGSAWWYQKYAPYNKTLQTLQTIAKRESIGLWNNKNAIAPWAWRRNKR